MFEVLPPEIIAEIISYLYGKDLLLTYKLSKQFKNVCDMYLVQILKERLTNKHIFVENISSKERLVSLYLNADLNVRCSEGIGDPFTNKKYVLGNNGKVYIITYNYKGQFEVANVLKDVHNIISISCTYSKSHFLRNDGYVDNQPFDNIVQIVQGYNKSFFLNSKGEIYVNKEIIHNLKYIITIKANDKNNLFLHKNGDIYEYDDKITKIENFKNIKDLLVSYYLIVTLDNNNILSVYDKSFSPFNFVSPININKVILSGGHLWVLNNNNELSKYCFFHDNTSTILLPRSDIVDFYPHFNKAFILTKDNKLILYNECDEICTLGIKGKISILDTHIITIDNVIHYVHDNLSYSNRFKYKIIKL